MQDHTPISSAFTTTQSLKESALPTTFGKCLRNSFEVMPSPLQISLSSPPPTLELRGEILIEHAQKHFPQSGILKVTEQGFIYLDISDRYILDLFELLHREDTFIPPYFDEEKGLFGAHVTIALAHEHRKTLHLSEIGEEIPFTLTGCYSASPKNWEAVSRVWFITIDAPRLSEVRKKLGLEPKIEGCEFHITFAIQKRLMDIDDLFSKDRSSVDTGMIFGKNSVIQDRLRFLRNLENTA